MKFLLFVLILVFSSQLGLHGADEAVEEAEETKVLKDVLDDLDVKKIISQAEKIISDRLKEDLEVGVRTLNPAKGRKITAE